MARFKSVIALCALSMLCVIAFGGTAQAHVLREDHGISGVLHMPPTDEPRAGETTLFYISFGDKQHAFSLDDCNCTITIKKDDKTLSTVPAIPQLSGATLASKSSYEFPQIGAYEIIARGHAKHGQFPDFTLNYLVRVATDVRVTALVAKQTNNSLIYIIGGGILAGVGIFGYAGMRDGGRYVTEIIDDKPKTRKKV